MGARSGLVALLIAVEIVIVGLALYTLRGGSVAFAAGGLHHIDYVAAPIAPLNAGSAPVVNVSDPDDRVVVIASHDGLVHVTDLTAAHGATWGEARIAPVQVRRTADGVSIERPTTDHPFQFTIFGWNNEQRIEVAVPPGSSVAIAQCSGADVTGINGTTTVKSQDGHIKLASLRADVDASSDDGYIEASDVQAPSVALHTSDGHLTLRNIAAAQLSATTDDGRIRGSGVRISGDKPQATITTGDGSIEVGADLAPGGSYRIATDDGHLTLTVPPDASLAFSASTDDGRIVHNNQSIGDDDSTTQTFTLGAGSGQVNLHSGDGTISVMTNGAI